MKRIYVFIILVFFLSSFLLFSAPDLEIKEEIFINNQGISVGEMIELWQYLRSDKKDDLQIDRIVDLLINVDIEGNIGIGINEDLEIGYLNKETYSFSTIEDTVACFYADDFLDGEYQVRADYVSQEINGLYLKKYFQKNAGLKIGFKGKILNGVHLERHYYEGIIEKEEDKKFFTGRRVSLDSDFYKITDLYEVDFKSYGWGLDLNCQWLLKERDQLSLIIENIHSRLIWEDVFTEQMNYYKSSLGLYSEKTGQSSSSGIVSFKDYQTRLSRKYKISYLRGKYHLGLDYYEKEYYPYLTYQLNDCLGLGFIKIYFSLFIIVVGLILILKQRKLDLNLAEKAMANICFKIKFKGNMAIKSCQSKNTVILYFKAG